MASITKQCSSKNEALKEIFKGQSLLKFNTPLTSDVLVANGWKKQEPDEHQRIWFVNESVEPAGPYPELEKVCGPDCYFKYPTIIQEGDHFDYGFDNHVFIGIESVGELEVVLTTNSIAQSFDIQ